MKTVKKIASICSKVLIGLLMVLMIVSLAFKISGSNVNLFGLNLYYIATPSMEPDLKVGDVILSVDVKDLSKLEVYDVITYKGEEGSYKGKLITHQIIEIKEENGEYIFITKGTNPNSTVDPEVSADQVVSKMLFEVPLVGNVVTLLKNKVAFFLVLVLPLSAMLVIETVNLVKAVKKDDEEKEE